MKTLINLKNKYRFVWDSGLLVVTGGVSGLLFAIFHATMKRMLGEVDYASVVALLALLNVLSLPVNALQMTISRFVAEHVHSDAVEVWVTIYKRAIRRITMIGLVAVVVWALFAEPLRRFFAAPSILSIIILGVIAVVRLYKPVINGVLQGAQRFEYLALCRLLNPAFRLVLSVLVVWMGGRVAGVMGAVAVGIALSLVPGLIPFRRRILDVKPIDGYSTAHIYRYLFPALLCQGALLLLMNSDVMFFKRFLYGEFKALGPAYAQAAMLSRVVFLLSRPLTGAMFPRAVNSSKFGVFFGPFSVALLISAGLALLLSFFPEIPFRLMYGTDDPDCFRIVRMYVWAALPLSLVGMTMKYLLARHQVRSALVIVGPCALYLILLFFFHRTPLQIISCLAVGSWGSLLLLSGAVYHLIRKGAE